MRNKMDSLKTASRVTGHIGDGALRVEDTRFLTGLGQYVDDLHHPGAAHAVFVRSQHAHAHIVSIQCTGALAMPGVLAILSADDWQADGKGQLSCMYSVPSTDGTPMREARRRVFAGAVARHVGDPLVVVIAHSLPLAVAAAEAVEVEIELLEAVADTKLAVADGVSLVHPEFGTNVAYDWSAGNEQATRRVFEKSPHTLQLQINNNRLYGLPLEPRAVVGEYDAPSDRYTLWSSTQMPHVIRDCLAIDSLRTPAHRIRVIAPDVGGGFGVKGSHFAEEAVVLWAAKRLKRTVRWTASRNESFVGDVHARDQSADAEIAFDETGRVQAVRADVVANLGAYASLFGAGCPSIFGSGSFCGPYAIAAAHFRVRGVYTNTVPTEAYRGAGMPEATNIIESLMEAAADSLRMDPLEFRLRNVLPNHDRPIVSALGVAHDSGSYFDVANELRDSYEAWRERQRAEPARNLGIGVSGYVLQASGGPSRDGLAIGSRLSNWDHARVSVHPGGEVTVTCGTHSHGQGHETTFRQVVASKLGIQTDDIEIVYGDTARVHAGQGTYASRAMVIVGNAIGEASDRIVEKGRLLAAHEFECTPEDVQFRDGRYRISGTDRELSFREIARAAWRGDAWPSGFEPGLDESCYVDPSQGTTPSGFHLCVVELDVETGALKILDYLAADDFGRLINPLIVEGQVHGAVAQGLGQAMGECCVYDEAAQLLTGSVMDYAVPRATDLPNFRCARVETPAPGNQLGIKGMGEAGTLPAPPAVGNALRDILVSKGCKVPSMPFTPHRVWRALNSLPE